MESLDHPIRLGMVWGRHIDLDAPCVGQLLEQGRRELGTSVGCDN